MGAFSYSIQRDGAGVLELSGELTVVHVRELHAALCASEQRVPVLEVRCSALTRMDAAAVQVLFAAAKHAEQPRVVDPSDAWSGAFSRYGLRDPFFPSV